MSNPYNLLSLFNVRQPRFPTPPQKTFDIMSMPNDLIANGRNYYTEMYFLDYRSSFYSGFTNWFGNLFNNTNGMFGALSGSGAQMPSIPNITPEAAASIALSAASGAIRLPIPRAVNDITVINWSQNSGLQDFGNVLGAIVPGASQLMQAGSAMMGPASALTGVTLNPLMYLAFNRPNFRTFNFEWVLAPKTRIESETVRRIIKRFKKAASPGLKAGGLLMDYPYVAYVRMYPNKLGGLAEFKPMVITQVSANYTANPNGLGFFENTGSPTVVALKVSMVEMKLWTREDFNDV